MKEEQVIIVDENDNQVAVVPRSEMRAKNLLHRASAVLVFNSKGELYIHQRTLEKDVDPGYYDTKIAGTVASGETYDENARRELKEEVGIKNANLDFIFMITNSDKNSKAIGKVFKCVYDGPIKIQKEEILHGKFMSIKAVKELMKKEKFRDSGIKIFEKYLETTQ